MYVKGWEALLWKSCQQAEHGPRFSLPFLGAHTPKSQQLWLFVRALPSDCQNLFSLCTQKQVVPKNACSHGLVLNQWLIGDSTNNPDPKPQNGQLCFHNCSVRLSQSKTPWDFAWYHIPLWCSSLIDLISLFSLRVCFWGSQTKTYLSILCLENFKN